MSARLSNVIHCCSYKKKTSHWISEPQNKQTKIPARRVFLNFHFWIPRHQLQRENMQIPAPSRRTYVTLEYNGNLHQNFRWHKSTAQECKASRHGIQGRSRGAYLLGIRGVGVGRVARSLEGLIQVGKSGGVAADPLRDVKPCRGHVETDGLVLLPRHGRSAAAQRGGVGPLGTGDREGRGWRGWLCFGWVLRFSWALWGIFLSKERKAQWWWWEVRLNRLNEI